MLVLRCDRCGAYYDINRQNFVVKYGTCSRASILTFTETHTLDFCEDCKEKFMKFLTMEDED